jgi:hypothetical protein
VPWCLFEGSDFECGFALQRLGGYGAMPTVAPIMRERLGGKPLALGPSDSRTTVVIQTVEKSHFVKKKYKKRKFPPWGREKKEEAFCSNHYKVKGRGSIIGEDPT